MSSCTHNLDLTIWIPTYQRYDKLSQILVQIVHLKLYKRAEIVVSDNHSQDERINMLKKKFSRVIRFEDRPCNITGGANFLRAFENSNTKWIHIMGDDDQFNEDYANLVSEEIAYCEKNTVAVKFDSSLYGNQKWLESYNLLSIVNTLDKNELNSWYNNLLLISGWIFNRELYKKYISTAYLGYNSKISHILPCLRAGESTNDKSRIIFSNLKPVIFMEGDDTWPRAATWSEMAISTQIFEGILSKENKRALKVCLYSGSFRRLAVKILRIRSFYRDNKGKAFWPKILAFHCLISARFMFASIVSLPLLLIGPKLWPKYLTEKLGAEGDTHRW